MKLPEQPRQFDLWIDGAWTKSTSGKTLVRTSPAHDCPVTEVPESEREEDRVDDRWGLRERPGERAAEERPTARRRQDA